MTEPFSRRDTLKCLGLSAGTLFTLSGGILTAMDPAEAQTKAPLFLQISDTHIGFNKEANPDVAGTLRQAHGLGQCAAAAAGPDPAHWRCHPSVPGRRVRYGEPASVAAEGANSMSCRASMM